MITGPPIAGTRDRVNAGRRPGDKTVVVSVIEDPLNAARPVGVRQVAAPGDAVHPTGARQDCLYGCEDPVGCSYPHLGCDHCARARE